jgi:hypothetical protein
MRRRAFLIAASLAFPLALTLTARAAEPIGAAPEVSVVPMGAAVPERWYGWQSLMVDLSSVATMAGGAFVRGAGTAPIEIVGAAGYLLGAPLVHIAHDQGGNVGTSLALRTAVPGVAALLGVLIAWAAFPHGTETGVGDHYVGIDKSVYQAEGGFIGFGAGAIAAIVVDDAIIAKEKVPPPVDSGSHLTIEPRVAGVRGGATFGIGGTF